MADKRTEKFLKEVKIIMAKFYDEVHAPLVKAVQEYKENNPDAKNSYNLSGFDGFKQLDDMALLTAWTIDKLDDLEGFVDSPTYKKTLTKKIRKVLGFTY